MEDAVIHDGVDSKGVDSVIRGVPGAWGLTRGGADRGADEGEEDEMGSRCGVAGGESATRRSTKWLTGLVDWVHGGKDEVA